MPKIIVIDDSPSALRAIESMLDDPRFDVAVFSMWAAAAEELKSTRVDLIITDVYMPETDGLEVLRARRTICPQVPVVAISGMDGHRDMLKVAKLMGACRTLRKPFAKEALLATISDILNGAYKEVGR